MAKNKHSIGNAGELLPQWGQMRTILRTMTSAKTKQRRGGGRFSPSY